MTYEIVELTPAQVPANTAVGATVTLSVKGVFLGAKNAVLVTEVTTVSQP